MGGLFNTRNLSFHTPYGQWDPIMRYYKALMGTQTRSIDLLPQVRVAPIDNNPNKFVVQWSLGGFGDVIPGTPLREYDAPNLEELNQWLYSMEDTRLETEKPYALTLAGTGVNFPRELHEFALSALTIEGDLIYLGNITPENIEESLPQMMQGLSDAPYWGVRSNLVAALRHSVERAEADLVQARREVQREIDDGVVPAGRLTQDGDPLPSWPETVRLLALAVPIWEASLEESITENNNRPFWRVLREGSASIITPTTVANIYNENNPPPNNAPQPYISPRTLGQALPTIYQMIISLLGRERRQQNINLLIRAVQEELGINFQRRFETMVSSNFGAPIISGYYGSSVETPFVVDAQSAKYLQVQNMSELAGSEYGLVEPVYNRYEPCLEAADFYEDAEENNLINFYTLNGTVNYEVQNNQRVPSGWLGDTTRGNHAYRKYQNLSTLSGSVDIDLLDIGRSPLPKYYKEYMNQLGDQTPPEERRQMGDVYKRAKFPEESRPFLTAYNYNQTLMPYYIEVNSTSGETGTVVETINNNRLSSYITDKVQKADFLDELTNYTITTDGISIDSGEVVSRGKNIPLRQRRFRDLLDVSRFTGISDLVYNIFGKEAISGAVAGGMTSRNLGKLLKTINREARNEVLSYTERVENKHFCGTEALLDIFNKRKQGAANPIAQTYIASPDKRSVNQFTDTQVKYGQEYKYDIQRLQMAYGTQYSYKTLDITIPTALLQASSDSPSRDISPKLYINYTQAGEAVTLVPITDEMIQQGPYQTPLPEQVVGYSFIVEVEPTEARLLELPIYDQRYDSFGENLAGVSLKPISVLDYPPTPPVLEIRPIRGNYRQLLINLNLEAISRTTTTIINGPQCLEGVDYDNLHQYQKTFIDFNLEEGKLIFQNDGLSEITSVKVIRTDKIIASAHEAENPIEEAYKSFCEDTNPEAEIVVKSLDQEPGQVGAASYGFTDDIEPNKYYYYTAYSKDLRDNVSNPSEIYQVRLVYDKGFLSPEISLLNIEEIPNKTPVKKMTRFMEIKASGIQTQPFMNTNEDGEIESYKSLIYKAGEAGDLLDINDQQVFHEEGFVIRLTSKDTGRKFDIRLKIRETYPIPDQGDPDSC